MERHKTLYGMHFKIEIGAKKYIFFLPGASNLEGIYKVLCKLGIE